MSAWHFGLTQLLMAPREMFSFPFTKSNHAELIGPPSECCARAPLCLDSHSLWVLVNVTSIKLLTVWLQGPLSRPVKWDWCPWLHTAERSQLEVSSTKGDKSVINMSLPLCTARLRNYSQLQLEIWQKRNDRSPGMDWNSGLNPVGLIWAEFCYVALWDFLKRGYLPS